MECNTIGWNFTKLNITNAGFVLVYEAGINSAIYSLAINYMVVDNFYLDYEIVYYSSYYSYLFRQEMYSDESGNRIPVRKCLLQIAKVLK